MPVYRRGRHPQKPRESGLRARHLSSQSHCDCAGKGQKIYTLNAQNAATALATLPVGGAVGQEIYAAVQAGKEVTVHEKPISAHGFTGYGYIITDPETGAGAYMIEGRGNGMLLLFQAMATLFALLQIMTYAKYAGMLKLLPALASVNPYIRLAIAFLALVGALSADNPYVQDSTAINLQIILTLVSVGLGAFAASPVLFSLVFITLTVFVANLIGRFTMLLVSKNNITYVRYA